MFKRINLININYSKLKIEGVGNEEIYNIMDDTNKVIIFNLKLNSISDFIKTNTTAKKTPSINNNKKKDINNNLKISEIINTKLSKEDINITYKS